eukprot:604622_1
MQQPRHEFQRIVLNNHGARVKTEMLCISPKFAQQLCWTKNGSYITILMLLSGASIELAPPIVTIYGTPKQVQAAELILAKMEKFKVFQPTWYETAGNWAWNRRTFIATSV